MFTRHITPGIAGYRDRVYIIKDIILKLLEYGELNQTALISFCGLNITKHRSILYSMIYNGIIEKSEKNIGKKSITVYKYTPKGLEFCKKILEPYEKMFPRQIEIPVKKDVSFRKSIPYNINLHIS